MEKNAGLQVNGQNIDNCQAYIDQCQRIFLIACKFYNIDPNENEGGDSKEEKKNNDKSVTSDCAKLDPTHKTYGHVYFANKSIENVYNGGVKWNTRIDGGRSYYGLDCGKNILAYCGGHGYKSRSPFVSCYSININNDSKCRMSSLTHGYYNLCKFGEHEVPQGCFVDDIHGICWYQHYEEHARGGIRGLTIHSKHNDQTDLDEQMVNTKSRRTRVIVKDKNKSKKTNKNSNEDTKMESASDSNNSDDDNDDENEDDEEDEQDDPDDWEDSCDDDEDESDSGSDNEDEFTPNHDYDQEVESGERLRYEYRLNGRGNVISTTNTIVSVDAGGILYSWQYDNLEKYKQGGQSPDVKHKICLVSDRLLDIKDTDVGISYCGINNDSKILVKCDNGLYFYDLNKQSVSDIFLGGRYHVYVPRRQHLYAKNRSVIMTWDFHCVKLYDTRMDNTNNIGNDGNCSHSIANFGSKVSVNGCGTARINSAIGFDVGGHSFVATGGTDEAVTIWDLRNMFNARDGALYELSTGNLFINELAWHESSQTIFATTEYMGYYASDMGYSGYGDDDDDHDNDWPKNAVHPKSFFKNKYNAQQNSLYSYSFLSQNS